MKKIILNLLILTIISSNSYGATTIKPNFDSIISVEIIKEDKNNEAYYFNKLKEERNLEKRMRIFRLVNHKSKTVSIVSFLLEFNMKSKYVEFKILFKPFVKK